MVRVAFLAGFVLTLFTVSRNAWGQLHWDAGINAGAQRRILTSGAGDGGIGPMVGLEAHIALIPLVRVGAYVTEEIAPTDDGAAARKITAGGIHAKGISPWPRGNFRGWIFAGLGYAGVYAPSYHRTLHISPDGTSSPLPRDTLVTGAGGSFFDVPVGIGASYKVRKPWEISLQVGARFGFGFTGSVYEGRAALPAGSAQQILAPLGSDTVAVFMTLGVSLAL